MGKTRYLFKKIRDTKGTFHAKMGSIKDRNGRNLREAEDIKKRWQEYTEELHKKEKCKKAKWLSEEVLQIAVKRRCEKQRRKGKIHPIECRVPKNSKER